jgi:hypothetical protein
MAKLSLLYVTLRPYHGTFAAKKKAVHASIKPARGEARGPLRGDKRSRGQGRVSEAKSPPLESNAGHTARAATGVTNAPALGDKHTGARAWPRWRRRAYD